MGPSEFCYTPAQSVRRISAWTRAGCLTPRIPCRLTRRPACGMTQFQNFSDCGLIVGPDSMDREPSPPPATHGEPSGDAPAAPRFYWAALAAVVAVFGAVRFACLFNDLWLDEIWSLRLVGQLQSPAEIVTRLWHDNNHPLNSLYLYLLAPASADWTYRLLSWFAGVASVALAGLIARRQVQLLHPGDAPAKAAAAGLITATVIGASCLLIHYSSEARGYAPAVGFSFLALYALLRAPRRPASVWAVVYGLACGLGILSHLVAFQVMLAGLVWSVVNALRTWDRWRDQLVHLVCWHLGPWVFLGLFYLAFVSKVELHSGSPIALSFALGLLSAMSLGFPGGLGVFVALPTFLGITVIALGLIWRRDRAVFGFYAVAIFVAPVLGVYSSPSVSLYPRYFIVSAAGALLLVGYVLARLWSSGRAGRTVGLLALAGFLLGNGAHTARLLRDGRGQYQRALRYVAERSPTATITVASDWDFRNQMVIQYYAKAAGPGHSLQYYRRKQLPAEGPQWMFLHRLDGEDAPTDDLSGEGRVRYRLDRTFPHAPLSGWTWYVYRNLDPSVLPVSSR